MSHLVHTVGHDWYWNCIKWVVILFLWWWRWLLLLLAAACCKHVAVYTYEFQGFLTYYYYFYLLMRTSWENYWNNCAQTSESDGGYSRMYRVHFRFQNLKNCSFHIFVNLYHKSMPTYQNSTAVGNSHRNVTATLLSFANTVLSGYCSTSSPK